METTDVSWQFAFFLGAGFFILFQAWRGWRMGIVRQVAEVISLLCAYAAGFFLGAYFTPLFRPLGWPDQVLEYVSRFAVGLVVFLTLSLASTLVFKRTKHQSGVIRFGFGAAGAILGGLLGIIFVCVAAIGVKISGTLAEARVRAEAQQALERQAARVQPWMRSLAQMKNSLERGPAGAVVEQVDPVPGDAYATLGQVAALLADQEKVERFLRYPGVEPIARHPKILALTENAQIAQEVGDGNILNLLRHPAIVEAANDPEVRALVQRFEFQKALDYTVGKQEKAPPAR